MSQPKRFTDEELKAHKNARSRQRYQENKEKSAAYHAALYQAKKVADPTFLAKQAAKAAKRRKADPAADKAVAKRSRERHAEVRRQEVREWFSKNPEKRRAYEQNRRALKRSRGGKLSPGIIASLKILQRGKCACCRVPLDSVVEHLDHIMPLALGGLHVDANMQLLCQPCNQAKYSKHPVDFMRQKGFLL